MGFFLGSVLLSVFGDVSALLIMAAGLLVILRSSPWLPSGMGKVKTKVPLKQLLSKSPAINMLSGARFFLNRVNIGSCLTLKMLAVPVAPGPVEPRCQGDKS